MAPSKVPERLKLKDVLAILWRSFFIQTGWNFKSMISIGFCFALWPVAKKVCHTKKEYIDFLKRHLGFFNAHPYFASYAIGATARLELEHAAKDKPGYDLIDKFKNALIGPLGAVGDQCCWAVIRPSALIFGLTGLKLAPTVHWKALVLLLTFILYNIPHIYIRVKGILDGYEAGFDVYKKIRIDTYQRMVTYFKIIGVVGIGMLFIWTFQQAFIVHWRVSIMFVIAFILGLGLRLKRNMFYTPVLVSMVLAIVIGIL